MLSLLDHLLFFFHLIIIIFNLTGWIWHRTRKLHLICVSITALSWFGGGFFYGLGYCFLTDWHWEIKYQIGEINLPNSFIKYLLDILFDADFDPGLIDKITGTAFGLIVILSIYFNMGLIKKMFRLSYRSQ